MATVNLRELVARCCDAAHQSAELIRDVHQDRLAGGDLKAALKDAGCERSWATVADTKAQAHIVAGLTEAYPGLAIVGEEDVPEADTVTGITLAADHPSMAGIAAPPRHEVVPLDTVTVFVDPVDGTREFVEGRVENVCTLIGIAVRGEAAAGVIGLPFWRSVDNSLATFDGSGDDASAVLCAIVDGPGGVGGIPPEDKARIESAKERRASPGAVLRLAASAEGATGSPVAAARDALCLASDGWAPLELVSTPGAGTKAVAVILGHCDAALLNLKGSLWDTCAPEALLAAAGGSLSDYFGARLLHSADNTLGMGNKLGAVVAAGGVDRVSLCRRLSATPEVVALLAPTGLVPFTPAEDAAATLVVASDIARTIEGAPLTAAILSKALGGDVEAFTAPETSAVRYKMAECCRLWVRYANNASGPRSFFVKRSVMRDLAHARAKITSAPHKLARDVRSYAVETSFLRSVACARLGVSPSAREVDHPGVRLARAVHSECHVTPGSLIDSSFSLVLEDFCHLDGWRQHGLLNSEEMRAALATLGRFHGFFWNGRVGASGPDDAADAAARTELEASVWDSGCYWSPKRQAPDQIDQLPERFARHGYAQSFAGHVAAMGGPPAAAVEAVGERLARYARTAARRSHLYLAESPAADAPFETAAGAGQHPTTGAETQSDRSRRHPHRTLVHGDLKAANLFFRRHPEAGTVEAGFIDFQWSGWGIGAVDIAYMMCAAAGPDALDLTPGADAETALLRHYHTALCAALVEYKAAATVEEAEALMPFATLVEQYETALLDHAVTVFSYLWNDLKATPEALTARAKKFPITANAVNKNADCGAWLLGRCAILLERLSAQ